MAYSVYSRLPRKHDQIAHGHKYVEKADDWVSHQDQKYQNELVPKASLVPANKVLVELQNDRLLRVRMRYELRRQKHVKRLTVQISCETIDRSDG